MVRNVVNKLTRWEMASVVLSVVLFFIILSFFTKGFNTAYNIDSLARTAAITTIVGIGQLAVLAIGQFNLALGSMGCCSALLTAVLMQEYGVPIWLSVLLGILAGIILGMTQGFLVVKTKINPFIITLSLSNIYLGMAIAATRSKIYNNLPQSFKYIAKVNVFRIPLLFIIALVMVIILSVLMYRTYIGRKILATGANERSALCAGINTGDITILAHSMSGLFAGIAGILLSTRLGSAQISVGSDWMLVSFAAPVLGGTLMSGGKVSVAGTIFGAILMSMITNGLVLINVNFYWFQAFLGIILMIAFEIDRIRVTATSQKYYR